MRLGEGPRLAPQGSAARKEGIAMHRSNLAAERAARIAAALLIAAAAVGLAPGALAQGTLDHPVGEVVPFALDSGALDNALGEERTVWTESVFAERSMWVRLHFAGASLPAGSFLRVTSLLDGEMQTLDAAALAMWSESSAYFNGEEVMLELVAGPHTRANRVVLEHITAQFGDITLRICGICNGDDRVPSSEAPFGRLMPSGCSASVYCEDGGLISAGHCGAGSDIVEFNVPPSGADCAIVHPPVEDQFPITDRMFSNNGVGNDWAVFKTGVNNLGESVFIRYGEIVPIAKSLADGGESSVVVGYGQDAGQCSRNYAQQTSAGVIKSRGATSYRFDNDVRGGSSGAALMVNGETVGVVTHCVDPCDGPQGNIGTRVDRAEFVAAREAMSACEIPDGEVVFETSPFFVLGLDVSPPDNNGESDGFTAFGRIWDEGTEVTVTAPVEASSGWCFDEWRLDGAPVGDDTTLMFTVEAGTQSLVAVYAQGVCFCIADFNQDGAVDTRDVISFLNAWNNGDSSSDIDNNGVIDTRDVLAFLNLWNAGC
jgi:hypothetical protein